MNRKSAIALTFVLTACGSLAAMRPTPAYLKSAVAYQIALRCFTREGNFKGATEMLEHVRSIGVDIVYLTPFVEMDRDMNRSGWSPRQIKSGFDSPKNSYRISDYDRIDPEYGTDADFKAFNDKAHALGMKVFMDLVYLHCGPNNVLKDRFPDAFQKNADGTVRTTCWNFPFVNFESKRVRAYLIGSMKHWMSLGCDGFRCDVGDMVPLDFWVEAVAECQKLNRDLVMINEGTKTEWLEKAFDACYAWPWSRTIRITMNPKGLAQPMKDATLSERMEDVRKYEAGIPKDSLMFCYLDNHDTAVDDGEYRFDRVNPVEAGNAAFVLTFLRRGLPLVYAGNEIADNALNSFFGPVEHPARARQCVDWGRALQDAGHKRLALLRQLAKMRHDDPIWSDGSMEWVTDGEQNGIIAFTRTLGRRKMLVAANLTATAGEGGPLVGTLAPYTYVIRDLTIVAHAGDRPTGIRGSVAYAEPGWCIWCPSAVALPDGRFALVHSRWPESAGFGAWLSKSEAALAISENGPLGPYRFVKTLLAGSGRNGDFDRDVIHNPTVFPDGGKYYLFYMGTYSDLTGEKSSAAPELGIEKGSLRLNQRIGVAVADSIEGPYVRTGRPLLPECEDCIMSSNPAVVKMPNGKYLMVFKWGWPPPARFPNCHNTCASAMADSPLGPWKIVSRDTFPVPDVKFPGEDPCLWLEKDVICCSIHDFGCNYSSSSRALVKFESKDGVHWTNRGAIVPKGRVSRLERPFVLSTPAGERLLFAASKPDDRRAHSEILVFPGALDVDSGIP